MVNLFDMFVHNRRWKMDQSCFKIWQAFVRTSRDFCQHQAGARRNSKWLHCCLLILIQTHVVFHGFWVFVHHLQPSVVLCRFIYIYIYLSISLCIFSVWPGSRNANNSNISSAGEPGEEHRGTQWQNSISGSQSLPQVETPLGVPWMAAMLATVRCSPERSVRSIYISYSYLSFLHFISLHFCPFQGWTLRLLSGTTGMA